MTLSLPRVCFIVIIALLFVISVVTLALQARTLDYLSPDDDDGIPLNPYYYTKPESLQRTIGILPVNVHRDAPRFAVAVSVISAITSIAVVIFTILTWPNGRRTYRIRFSYLVASIFLLTTFLSFVALLFTFVTHSHSSHFDATYRIRAGGNAPSGFCDIGDFDLETWACDLAGQNTTKTMHNILTTQCAVSSASRWILVPFFVTGFLGTVVGWWALGSAAERVKEKSEETPGKGEENDGWGT